uniref:Uncharacterized protein n=1 Tax=Loa loa TaxID=7209 RepID=A0A1I7VV13_LOALO
MAHYFGMKPVIEKCENVIVTQMLQGDSMFQYTVSFSAGITINRIINIKSFEIRANTLDRVKLFQITCAVAEYDRYSPTMTLLIDKLSAMKREELSTLRFSQVPGDIVADVFAAKMKRREMKRKKWCCLL